MKIICVSIFLYFLIINGSQITAQEIDWDKIYLGGSVQFSVSDGDLNRFWGNFFSPGLLLQYQPDKKFLFEIGISGSYLKPAEINSGKFPGIVIVNSMGILKYNVSNNEAFSIYVSPGFTNTAFIFTGDAADRLDDNFIEYEFGIYFSSGMEFSLTDGLAVESFLSIQNIFSFPSNLVFYTSGLKFIFK